MPMFDYLAPVIAPLQMHLPVTAGVLSHSRPNMATDNRRDSVLQTGQTCNFFGAGSRIFTDKFIDSIIIDLLLKSPDSNKFS